MKYASLAVALIALIFIGSPPVFAEDNFIKDGSFEESPHTSWGNWKDWGPGTRDFENKEKVHEGRQSYKVTLANSSRWNSDIALQEDISGIEAGDKFEASAYVLIPQDKPLSEHIEAYLEVIFFGGSGNDPKNEVGKFQSKKYGYGKSVPNWEELKISGAAPVGAKNCKLQLVVLPLPYLDDEKKSEETYSGTVYFDNVKLINKSRKVM